MKSIVNCQLLIVHQLKQSKTGGFTLLELMVTLAIFTVMTSAILANYPRFQNKIALEVLAQNVALSVRQAQVFGISIRAAELGLSDLAPAYGIHFEGATTGGVPVTQENPYRMSETRNFVLFADKSLNAVTPGNGAFNDNGDITVGRCVDAFPNSECVQVFNVTGLSAVGVLCQNLFSNLDSDGKINSNRFDRCFKAGENLTHATVLFKRPNPEASISGKQQTPLIDVSSISDLAIFVRSTNGATQDRVVVIWNTGQISVQVCETNSASPNFRQCASN